MINNINLSSLFELSLLITDYLPTRLSSKLFSVFRYLYINFLHRNIIIKKKLMNFIIISQHFNIETSKNQ
jgi:hypothetical protein